MKTMKMRILALVVFVFGALNLSAQNKTEELKVYGNCGMCETRIETAANSIDGVSDAAWDKETKMLSVSIDASKAAAKDVHQAVALVGHDTDMSKTTEEVYNRLPGCCKYDREIGEKKSCCDKAAKKDCDTKDKATCDKAEKNASCDKAKASCDKAAKKDCCTKDKAACDKAEKKACCDKAKASCDKIAKKECCAKDKATCEKVVAEKK